MSCSLRTAAPHTASDTPDIAAPHIATILQTSTRYILTAGHSSSRNSTVACHAAHCCSAQTHHTLQINRPHAHRWALVQQEPHRVMQRLRAAAHLLPILGWVHGRTQVLHTALQVARVEQGALPAVQRIARLQWRAWCMRSQGGML